MWKNGEGRYITGNFATNQEGVDTQNLSAMVIVEGTLGVADTGGGVASLKNPFGVDVIVLDAVLDITTKAAAACTVDAGIAANGTTLNDKLIDGLDVHTATGVFSNVHSGGTNGKIQKWGKDQFFTASKASGAAAGLKGKFYLRCIVA